MYVWKAASTVAFDTRSYISRLTLIRTTISSRSVARQSCKILMTAETEIYSVEQRKFASANDYACEPDRLIKIPSYNLANVCVNKSVYLMIHGGNGLLRLRYVATVFINYTMNELLRWAYSLTDYVKRWRDDKPVDWDTHSHVSRSTRFFRECILRIKDKR